MKLFVDFDGTLVNSQMAILNVYKKALGFYYEYNDRDEIFREEYNKFQVSNFWEIIKENKKWDFSDVCPLIYNENYRVGIYDSFNHVLDAFDNKAFFEEAESCFYDGALSSMDVLINLGITSIICTSGLPKNIELKVPFIHRHMPKASIIPIYLQGSDGVGKTVINMEDSIFIDDHLDNLITSNAKYKILFKHKNNNLLAEWQLVSEDMPSDIMVVRDWAEAFELIYTIKNETLNLTKEILKVKEIIEETTKLQMKGKKKIEINKQTIYTDGKETTIFSFFKKNK